MCSSLIYVYLVSSPLLCFLGVLTVVRVTVVTAVSTAWMDTLVILKVFSVVPLYVQGVIVLAMSMSPHWEIAIT